MRDARACVGHLGIGEVSGKAWPHGVMDALEDLEDFSQPYQAAQPMYKCFI